MSDFERRLAYLGERIDTHMPTTCAVLLVLLCVAVAWAVAERRARHDRTLRAYEAGKRDAEQKQIQAERAAHAEREADLIDQFAADVELLDTLAGQVLLERIVERQRREEDGR